MKLIVGLGNPGPKYQKTRHNFGFMLLDYVSHAQRFTFSHVPKFKGELAEVNDTLHQKIYYLKPQTYMNLSGQSVGPLVQFYKIAIDDILVVYDDIDLPLGKIRFARKGASGGHNGVRSIIEALGSQNFHRLKLGVGRPNVAQKEVSDHVLEKFHSDESKLFKETLERSAQALQNYIDDGVTSAMNQYN